LTLYTGAARIIERMGVADTAPVALRYEFQDDFRPEAFVRLGRFERITVDENFDAKHLTHRFTEALTGTLDRLRADVLTNNLEEYCEIVAVRRRRRQRTGTLRVED
jgi:hypothetical protein